MSNKAVFLDRDGTINKFVNYLHRIEDFELLAGVGRAIRLINESEYLCIVISNQPMVAMGMLSEEELDRIHCKMRSLLKLEGAYLDDIFYCPHADKPGLIVLPEYNIDCECKKPLPGLFYRASEKYDIDLSKSYMVGDRIRIWKQQLMQDVFQYTLVVKNTKKEKGTTTY